MYHLYHTDGFVLKNIPFGEANRSYALFTRELGLVKASAQGVRLAKSKLRPGLLDFSYSHFALVRGKNMWRITSAVLESNIYRECVREKQTVSVFARVFLLLQRLLHGEERNEILFEHIVSAYEFARTNDLSAGEGLNFECALVLRVLHALGYVGNLPGIDGVIHSGEWDEGVLGHMEGVRARAIIEINKSLAASHL